MDARSKSLLQAAWVACCLVGCAEEAPGWIWEVTLDQVSDECNDPPVSYSETLDYVLTFEGANVQIAVDSVVFATGSISGCDIDYTSPTWIERRDEGEIRWRIDGRALFRQGGQTCNLDAGIDWSGMETLTVVGSTVPTVPVGCRFGMEAEGVYRGER